MTEITREYLQSLQSFETEGEYRSSPSINYSTLKELDNGPRCLTAEGREFTGDAIVIGNYVDAWFTDKEKLKDMFEVEKPGILLKDSLDVLCKSLMADEMYSPTLDEAVARAKELGLWTNVKKDDLYRTRITQDLFDKLKIESEKSDKTRLTVDQLTKATYSIDNITNNESTMELISEGEDEIVINQFKWEFEMTMDSGRARKFRVMYDKLKFCLKTKEIIGIDIKTGIKPSHLFGDSFFEYRYDIQGILYWFGMMAFRKIYLPDWELPDPENFRFVYSPKYLNSKSAVIKLDRKFVEYAAEGEFTYKGKTAPGAWSLMNDADWYLENQEFETHRVLAESNYVVNISDLL